MMRKPLDADVEVARVAQITLSGRVAAQVINELEEAGFMCAEISTQQQAHKSDAPEVYFCRTEFRERGRLFPTQLNVVLLIDEDGALISSEHHVHRLIL